MHAVRSELSLDHRHGGRYPVALQDLRQHEFAGEMRAGKIGSTDKGVAVDLCHPVAGAILRGGVRYGDLGEGQCGLEERKGIEDPALLRLTGLLKDPGPGGDPAPGPAQYRGQGTAPGASRVRWGMMSARVV